MRKKKKVEKKLRELNGTNYYFALHHLGEIDHDDFFKECLKKLRPKRKDLDIE